MAPAACACATCGADRCARGGYELLAAVGTGSNSDSDDGGDRAAVARGVGKLLRRRKGRVSKYRNGGHEASGRRRSATHIVPCWPGTFDTAEDATHAYDIAAVEFWGRRAKLNFHYNAAPALAPSWVPTSMYHLLQLLPESLHETCGLNASSAVHVALATAAPAGQHGVRPVPKEQNI
uniref:AP2/ERF domain-containing protein n=1 Tax=Setaria viridis TaxID=4556 RepID=A0A4U6UL49_SETVI|nr:LOW QUALITY PROTEIN: hypothetical protein SEVIR_5G285200v2 [Setaria viridis]